MADTNPFQPTVDDIMSMTSGMPNQNMVARGFAMGADPAPKPPITGQPQMGAMPWWLAPLVMGLAGQRGQKMPQMTPAPRMGTNQPRRMVSANDNAQDQNAPMPMLNTGNQSTMSTGGTSQSQVGRLNALNDQQFQMYLQARDRGMSPQEAMAAAQGRK